MKLHVPATSAYFPAALTAAAICLSLLLLPGGGVPARSSGVAPALRLAAGEVVAAVKEPVRAVTGTKAKPAAVPVAARTAETRQWTPSSSSSSRSRSVPAHRAGHHHRRVSSMSATFSEPVTAPATLAPRPTSFHASKSRGKAKAVGHLRKAAPVRTSSHMATQSTLATHGRGKARGHSTDVQQGPPVVPPGHLGVGPTANEHAAPGSRGGGK